MKAFRIALSALALATVCFAGVMTSASAGEGTDYLSANRGKMDERYSGAYGY